MNSLCVSKKLTMSVKCYQLKGRERERESFGALVAGKRKKAVEREKREWCEEWDDHWSKARGREKMRETRVGVNVFIAEDLTLVR